MTQTFSVGRWHGDRFRLGLHYDLHATSGDTALGTRANPGELLPSLAPMAPDFLQTDCKGHAGYVSWFSKTPGAAVPPGLTHDALRGWVDAAWQLGVPLHCHYSGIWDAAAGTAHPEWVVTPSPTVAAGKDGSWREKMCPRSLYLTELLIPQLRELIDRYGVHGFWVDGDLWSVEPCYCARCLAAWHGEGNADAPPEKPGGSDWAAWWRFTLRSFEAFVTHYTNAVHAHKPGVLVCSNWLQTLRNPGDPARVPTDWISGDNATAWGLDACRAEARFLATRNKPWDIMVWSFFFTRWEDDKSPHVLKSRDALCQEIAPILALGGNVQIYETPGGVRDGRLVGWRMKRLGEVAAFVRERQEWCAGAETLPQVAVLHSETHLAETAHGRNLMHDVDMGSVQGAVWCLLECHVGVDVLDEWAATATGLARYPVVVVPERHAIGADTVARLREYVANGGRLLVTGGKSLDAFGADFLGVTEAGREAKTVYEIPVGFPEATETVPLYSDDWTFAAPTTASAIASNVQKTPMLPSDNDSTIAFPAATLRSVGEKGGAVAYIGGDVFHDFERNRYPATRRFIRQVVETLAGDTLSVRLGDGAPTAIDLAVRVKNGATIIHLINRVSGLPNHPNAAGVDEIPALGAFTVRVRRAAPPASVVGAWENTDAPPAWKHDAATGWLTVRVPGLRLHAALVVAS